MEELTMSDKTYEVCPHCDNEVKIDANKPSECPECSIVILPCSTCYDENDNRMRCDWEEEKRCWRFPRDTKLKDVAKKLITDAVNNKHLDFKLTESEVEKILNKHDFDIEDIFYNALIVNLTHKITNVWHETGI